MKPGRIKFSRATKVAMLWNKRQADLNPPLGYPGGPCYLIQRILARKLAPKTEEELIRLVERGVDLDKPENRSHLIYDKHLERKVPGTQFEWIGLTSHAQYRMDLRGITLPDIRAALMDFQKELSKEKSRKSPWWVKVQRAMDTSEEIQWVSKRLDNLVIGFIVMTERKVAPGAFVQTVYFQGEAKPGPIRREDCEVWDDWTEQTPQPTQLEKLFEGKTGSVYLAARSKESGVFQAPPVLVSEIEGWVLPLYAGHVLAWGEDFLSALDVSWDLPRETKEEGLRLFGRGSVPDWKEKIRDIMDQARGFASSGEYVVKAEKMGFVVNNSILKSWRYEGKVPPRAAAFLRAMGKDKIFVQYDPHLNPDVGGFWRPDSFLMAIRSQPMPSSSGMFLGYIAELRRVIRHEAQHVGQTLLSIFLGAAKDVAGLPPRHVREKGYNPYGASLDGGAGLEHALRDVEYHTRLQDEIDRFVALAAQIPPEELRRALKATTGISRETISKYEFGVAISAQEFFVLLRAFNKSKWRRAVADFLVGVEAAGVSLSGAKVKVGLKSGPEPVTTYVSDKSEQNLPTDQDRENQSVLPLPGSATPGGAGRDIPKFEYNTPGPGSNISERPRTLGVPGEQYGVPYKEDYNMPTRRTMTASRLAAKFMSRGSK